MPASEKLLVVVVTLLLAAGISAVAAWGLAPDATPEDLSAKAHTSVSYGEETQ